MGRTMDPFLFVLSFLLGWYHSASVSVLDRKDGIYNISSRTCTAHAIHADQRPTARGSGPHPWHQQLPSQQFQALFNSLFKVLFIFPSRYFFAIGLSPVFSLRRNLPPTSDCNPKQPDSTNTTRGARTKRARRGSHPL